MGFRIPTNKAGSCELLQERENVMRHKPCGYAAFTLCLGTLLLNSQNSYGQAVSPSRIYQSAKPATVIVLSHAKFEFSVPDVSLDTKSLSQAVTSRLKERPGERDPEKLRIALLYELSAKPGTYFQRQGQLRTLQGSERRTSGSGFLAHSSGYIVTNAHIVQESNENIEAILAKRVFRDNLDAALKIMDRTFPELVKLSATEREALSAGLRTAYARFCRLQGRCSTKREVKVVMSPDLSGKIERMKLVSAEVVVAGRGWPGKDVAILKIPGNGYPTVPLGDEARINVGDQIFVIGYPGAASSTAFSETSRSEATMTSGLISAKKAVREGFTALQTQAPISGGNSGGPIFSGRGEVIGIATATGLDRATGHRAEGIHFIVPATVIKEYLNRANVK